MQVSIRGGSVDEGIEISVINPGYVSMNLAISLVSDMFLSDGHELILHRVYPVSTG